MKKFLPLQIYFRKLFYKKMLLSSIKCFFISLTFFYIIFVTGCNKTGIKGIVIYSPTGMPIENIEITAIPQLNTEEKTDFIKSGTSDKNGEFKITGLDPKYIYYLVIENNKYRDSKSSKNFPRMVSSMLTKDQTTIVDKIEVVDKLPGNKNYVKRQNGKFEELTPVPGSLIRTISLTVRYNYPAYYVNIDEVAALNPLKVKNGEVIFCGSPSSTATSKTFLYPIQKCTYDKKIENALAEDNINNIFFIGKIHAKPEFYRVYTIEEEDGGLGMVNYYYVNLPKGFYIYSGDRITHNNVKPFVFEVIDEPTGDEEGD